MDKKKIKTPIEHVNIAEFNRGQSSRIIKELVENDKTTLIQKNGKPLAVLISYERYQRLFEENIDINDF